MRIVRVADALGEKISLRASMIIRWRFQHHALKVRRLQAKSVVDCLRARIIVIQADAMTERFLCGT